MTYPPADTRAQWFQDDYPGAAIDANVGVLHTTEGSDWPDYEGGSKAPNYTAKPMFGPKGAYLRLDWRAHFPDDRSSRALRNEAGGVETNTLGALQVELVGTCSPDTHKAWLRNNVPHIFWPEAPEAVLEDLAEFVAWAQHTLGIPVRGPKEGWLAYPASYGNTRVRFTGTQWREFYGWCGHQHVPENDHGDPGNIDWDTIEKAAEPVDHMSPAPMVLDLSVLQAAFRAVVKGEDQPTWSRTAVRRLQRALNQVHQADLKADGKLTPATIAAWKAHETEAGGKGRPVVPDAKSMGALKTLAEPRFIVVQN
jgi:hypothetical protein